jgi:hypothetical protein
MRTESHLICVVLARRHFFRRPQPPPPVDDVTKISITIRDTHLFGYRFGAMCSGGFCLRLKNGDHLRFDYLIGNLNRSSFIVLFRRREKQRR